MDNLNLNFKQWFNEVFDRRLHGDFGSCDVFRNPTKEELGMAVDEDWESQQREYPGRDTSGYRIHGTVRGWLTRQGDVYIWADNAFSHDQIARRIFSDPRFAFVAFYISRDAHTNNLKLVISYFSTRVGSPRKLLEANPNYCKMMEIPHDPTIKVIPEPMTMPNLSNLPNYDYEDDMPSASHWDDIDSRADAKNDLDNFSWDKRKHHVKTNKHDLNLFLKQAWDTMANRHKQG